MTKFALLADIHEQLRLGADRVKQLARLKTADDVLALYQFFFTKNFKIDVHSLLAKEVRMFYDVVRDMLPEEEAWMALASESSNRGSRDFDADYVFALPTTVQVKTFSEVAQMFNEKEARLFWRWSSGYAPVISKRTFLSALAKAHNVPTHLMHNRLKSDLQNIKQIFEDKKALLSTERWWEYDYLPAPMKWKPYTALSPPKENMIAKVIYDDEKIIYSYAGRLWDRKGYPVGQALPIFVDSYVEFTLSEITDTIDILDWVDCKSPEKIYDDRMVYSLNFLDSPDVENNSWETNLDWDFLMQELHQPNVRYIRLIDPNQKFEPDRIGGYVLHPDRTKVFLRGRHENPHPGDNTVILYALDGIDEFIPVANSEHVLGLSKKPSVFSLEENVVVVEVAAVRVSEKGQLLDFSVVGIRHDLGISDVTQFTELVERGMS